MGAESFRYSYVAYPYGHLITGVIIKPEPISSAKVREMVDRFNRGKKKGCKGKGK